MNKNPKVSVIVPVYKAEAYLHRCVESLLAQTFQDYEILLIDDGSPDKSGEICEKYAQMDSRIRVFHKENGGVSSARQCGIDNALGEYIIHADPDDWVEPNMLECLVNQVLKTNADVIMFDFHSVSNGDIKLIKQQPKDLNHINVLKDIIGGRLYACCWNKLVKKEAILRFNASFPKGINLGEDKCFLASLMKYPVIVSYVPQPLYYYDETINKGSLVRNITKESMESGFAMVRYLEDILDSSFYDELFFIKRNLKIRALKSNLYKKCELKKIYQEINLQLIKRILTLKSITKGDLALLLWSI